MNDTADQWRQLNLWCEDWRAAETMAVRHLGPLLAEAETTGHIRGWWFIRKGDVWRLRVLPAAGDDQTATTFFGHLTTTLADRNAIQRPDSMRLRPKHTRCTAGFRLSYRI